MVETALARIHTAIDQMRNALAELETCIGPIASATTKTEVGREEFLSLKELIARIPYEEQTIRNLMCQGELREGVHYLQRVKHGRVVFVWSQIQKWMSERGSALERESRYEQLDKAEGVYHARTRQKR